MVLLFRSSDLKAQMRFSNCNGFSLDEITDNHVIYKDITIIIPVFRIKTSVTRYRPFQKLLSTCLYETPLN